MKKILIYEDSLKFARASYGILLLIGYLVNNFWLVGLTGALMLLGAVSMSFNLFYQLHHQALRKVYTKRSSTPFAKEADEIRFSCGLPALFLFLAFLISFQGLETLAWILVGIVILLSLFAGLSGLCVGSLMYVILKKNLCKKNK